jgi:hypothetical protein
MRRNLTALTLLSLALSLGMWTEQANGADDLAQTFQSPPDSARPGVYWYFMDGNLNNTEMIADLESMKAAGLGNLVFSSVDLKGPQSYSAKLPVPAQRLARFRKMRNPFYEDVAVFAFPSSNPVITNIDEKALYERGPFSIRKDVKPQIPALATYPEPKGVISPNAIVELTEQFKPDGTLDWNMPAGDWTVRLLSK